MIPNKKIFEIIVASRILDKDAAKKAFDIAQSNNQRLDMYCVEKKLVHETELYSRLAKEMNVPFVDISNKTLDYKLFSLIPEHLARRNECVVFGISESIIDIAMTDPSNIEIVDLLSQKFNKTIRPSLASPFAIQQIFKHFSKNYAILPFLDESAPASAEKSKNQSQLEVYNDASIIQIVDQILERAIFQNASDIHIEPQEKAVIIRYRIDGVLREVMTLPKNQQMALLARIKVLSSLKLDEHRLPQDGRFTIRNQEYKVAFRVSVMPIFDGEKIVLRILNESAQVLDLEQLGLQEEPLVILRRNISKPHGMILVTGPTGSGKTTTLYTILNILNTPHVNILTIEDPIEYRIPRVNQSQVQPKIGYSFSNGLRSILRQDPNIVMVGEIRDNETAEIAVHAAMTGHLLLSTLHTNDAAGALPRLNEMGVPSFLIASTTNLVIAQRLVRKLCPECKKSYILQQKDIETFGKQLDFSSLCQTLKKHASNNREKELRFFRSLGCEKCNMEGYQGRIGIYELLEVSKAVAQCILKGESAIEIKRVAAKEGMMSMLEDGFIKAQQGITSIEEVLRVTKE